MRSCAKIGWLGIAVLVFAAASVRAAGDSSPRDGVAVLGDSYSDEYRFYPPERHHARNWVEILSELRGVNFGEYVSEDRGVPRRQGYSFNWARSAATTSDLIREGQHLGAAAQVRSGEVGIVWIFIGGNDFLEAIRGDDPEKSLETVLHAACANLDTAVETLLNAAAGVRVVLVTVPDLFAMPETAGEVARGRFSARVLSETRKHLRAYNQHLLGWPRKDRRVLAADLDSMLRIGMLVLPREIPVGSVRVRRDATGFSLGDGFLPDGRHAGTLVQGAMAQFFVTVMNAQLGTGIPPLTGAEIVEFGHRLESELAAAEPVVSGAAPQSRPAAP